MARDFALCTSHFPLADVNRMAGVTPLSISPTSLAAAAPRGEVELIVDNEHYRRVVLDGMLGATTSLTIATADLKAMMVVRPRRPTESIISVLHRLADAGVETRLLHAGVPTGPVLRQLRLAAAKGVTLRRCPRLHAKAVIIDCRAMFLGSANVTGAGLGAKSDGRRNFEWGVWTTSPALIDAVLDEFDALWEGRRCEGCQLGKEHCPVPLEEPRL
jgi:phosphatidylserine/phosphatidylglycerophosphate/cardiolipin synthase-like enzyme